MLGVLLGLGALGGVAEGPFLGEAHAQTQQAFELPIEVAPALHPRSVVLGATGRLLLRDRAWVSAPITNLGSGQTELGVEASAFDVYSEQQVSLRNHAVVDGSIVTTQPVLHGHGSLVQGAVSTGATFSDPAGKTFLIQWPEGSAGSLDLQPNQTQTLSPGAAYGRVEAKQGATLVLPRGKFYFDDLVVHPGATVVLASGMGAVEIYVKGGFTWRGQVVDSNDTDFPSWLVGVVGTQRVAVEAQFRGLLVAPFAELTLAQVGAGYHEGQFFARDIEVHPDTEVRYRTTDFLKDPPAAFDLGAYGGGCQTSLGLVGEDESSGMTRYSGVYRDSPEPGCSEVQFCSGAFGRGAPLDVLDRLDHPPFTAGELVTCQPEGQRGVVDCPIDTATVDTSSSCNSDSDCPHYRQGQVCASVCSSPACEGTVQRCAYRADCGGLHIDPQGCAPEDIWQCAPPVRRESASAIEAQIRLITASWGGGGAVSPGTVEEYGNLVGPCDPLHLMDFDVRQGLRNASATEIGGEGGRPNIGGWTAAEQAGLSPITLGDQDFGGYVYPRIFRRNRVEEELLDLDQGRVEAQAALVAGVFVFGNHIDILDEGVTTEADVCGFDAKSAWFLFGNQMPNPMGAPDVDQHARTECNQQQEVLLRETRVLHRYMYAARRGISAYQNGDVGGLCSVVSAELFDISNFDCSAHDPERMVNQLIHRYREQALRVDGLRRAFLNGRFASAGTYSAATNAGGPFYVKGGRIDYPLGPLTLTVDAQVTGHTGIERSVSTESRAHTFSRGKREPLLNASATIVPTVGATVALYAGVGVDAGVAGVSVGAEGSLELLSVQFPISASATLKRTTLDDPRDLQGSVYAGAPLFGLPSNEVTHWEEDSHFGARANLASLDGYLELAARVRFLFWSETFRHRLVEWEGERFIDFDWVGNWPLAQATPTANPTEDWGVFDDPVAFTNISYLGEETQTTLLFSQEPAVCIIVR